MTHNDSWPRFYPAKVTTQISAASGSTAGQGQAKLYRTMRSTTPGEFTLETVPTDSDPDLITVLTRDLVPIPVNSNGFVAEDGRGTLWWVSTPKQTDLIRFTLDEDLEAFGTAASRINSDGPDNDTSITVTAWARNSGNEGDKGIAWKYEFDGTTTYWIVELVSTADSTQLIRFTLYTDLPTGTATATAFINSDSPDDGTVISVTAWSSNSGVAGDKGIAWKYGFEGTTTYWIIELVSESIEATAFVLTANASYGAFNAFQSIAAAKLLADGTPGDSITVKTLGRTRGLIGCRGTAVGQAGEWVVTELQQPAHAISANLYSDCPPASTSIVVTIVDVLTTFPADFPPSASVLDVDNPLSLHGYSGTLCILHYDATNARYYLALIRKQATRIKGIVQTDFDAGDTTCTLEYLEGLDGVLPASLESDGQVTVQNIHLWDGTSESTARAEYNWTTQQWELYQIDCSEDQGIPISVSPVG